MPTINRTTSGMVSPSSATIQSSIDSLRTSIAAGATIQASHINSLLAIWRSFNDHYHTVDDLIGIADYGNTNPPGYSASGTFSPVNGSKSTSSMGGTEPADVSVGDLITAAKHEEIRLAISAANDHIHTIDDVAS